jgi:hypothetical protein
MIAARPQPNARSVGESQPAALGLLTRGLQPLALPEATLEPVAVIIQPARRSSSAILRSPSAVAPGKLETCLNSDRAY